jgi:hypothetical protein
VLVSGERALRTSALRVRYAQRGGFYSSRVNLAAFLFFGLRSIWGSVAALRRVVSGWSATRQLYRSKHFLDRYESRLYHVLEL